MAAANLEDRPVLRCIFAFALIVGALLLYCFTAAPHRMQ
jgi:hypothetical protein